MNQYTVHQDAERQREYQQIPPAEIQHLKDIEIREGFSGMAWRLYALGFDAGLKAAQEEEW